MVRNSPIARLVDRTPYELEVLKKSEPAATSWPTEATRFFGWQPAPYRCHWIVRSVLVCSLVLVTSAAFSKDYMLRARVDGKLLEGKPLSWSKSRIYLLSRDGQLVNFHPKEAQDVEKSSPRFYSYSTGEIRSQLYEEFGKQFDVTGTGHYLVVHPRGQRDQWAERFEKLYRSFNHYFRRRGFDLKEPKYPLVAIVFHNREDYRRYGTRTGADPGKNTLGHYDDWTNRISLFDITAENSSRNWSLNAETIIHEAAHQTAFNTGVHTRFTNVPRWLCEGLATMFEVRGVWDSGSYYTAHDRINRNQLKAFNNYVDRQRVEGAMTQLIASDRFFKSNTAGASAEAWALSHYLSETQPHSYSKYLALTANRPSFRDYSPQERVADFKTVFGDDLKMAEVRFLRYMKRVEL